jgi:hypothetical protein
MARIKGSPSQHDAAANTYLTWPGSEQACAPRILIGSHLDSVPHGGNFDGAAGVVAGLVVIAALKGAGHAAPLRRHRDGRARRGERLVRGLLYRQPLGAGHPARMAL